MPKVELKFIPVGYVNPKTMTGKGYGVATSEFRWALGNPLSFASRESQGKYYMVFSITGQGGNQLSIQAFNQDNTLVYNGKRMIGAIAKAGAKAGVDWSTGLWLEAQEAIDITEFEAGIATKSIHGTAVVVATPQGHSHDPPSPNDIQVSNVVTFSIERTLTPTIGTGFKRGQAYKTVKDIEEAYELFPEASAEIQQQLGSFGLSQETQKIFEDWYTKKIIIPTWFIENTMQWVLSGQITEQEFLAGYQNLVNTGIITYSEEPEPEPEEEILGTNLNLIPPRIPVKQTLSKLKIENDTITGRIDFVATNDFSSQLLGTSIVSIIQVKTKAGVPITEMSFKNIIFSKINDTYTIDGILAQNSAITDHNEVIFESFVWKSVNQPLALSTMESQPIKKEEKLLTTSNIEILIYNVEKTKVIGNILTSVSNEDYKRLDDEYSLEDRVKIRVESNSDIKPETDFTSLLIRIQELLDDDIPPPPPPEPNANMVRQEIGRFQVVNKTLKGKVTYIATDSFDEHFYYNFENNSGEVLKCYVIATDSSGNVLLSKQNDLRFSETERDETITISDYVDTEENKITVEFYVTNTPTQDSFEDDFAFIRTITTPYFPKKPDTLFGALYGLIAIPTALTLLGRKT